MEQNICQETERLQSTNLALTDWGEAEKAVLQWRTAAPALPSLEQKLPAFPRAAGGNWPIAFSFSHTCSQWTSIVHTVFSLLSASCSVSVDLCYLAAHLVWRVPPDQVFPAIWTFGCFLWAGESSYISWGSSEYIGHFSLQIHEAFLCLWSHKPVCINQNHQEPLSGEDSLEWVRTGSPSVSHVTWFWNSWPVVGSWPCPQLPVTLVSHRSWDLWFIPGVGPVVDIWTALLPSKSLEG